MILFFYGQLHTFSFRCFSLLYVQKNNIEKFYIKCAGNPLTSNQITEGGLDEIIKKLETATKVQKTDSRVTGSELIDSSLQEILGYIIRDYVSTWYGLITRDTELIDITVKNTAQTFAINISNRFVLYSVLCCIHFARVLC